MRKCQRRYNTKIFEKHHRHLKLCEISDKEGVTNVGWEGRINLKGVLVLM